MSTTTRRKRRSPRSPSEWAKTVAEWQRSGLSVAQYAKQHDLGESNLWRWSQRVRQRKRGRGRQAGDANPTTGFVPVQVVSGGRGESVGRHQGSRGSIELELPNGCLLRLRGDVSPEGIRTALSALQDALVC